MLRDCGPVLLEAFHSIRGLLDRLRLLAVPQRSITVCTRSSRSITLSLSLGKLTLEINLAVSNKIKLSVSFETPVASSWQLIFCAKVLSKTCQITGREGHVRIFAFHAYSSLLPFTVVGSHPS